MSEGDNENVNAREEVEVKVPVLSVDTSIVIIQRALFIATLSFL